MSGYLGWDATDGEQHLQGLYLDGVSLQGSIEVPVSWSYPTSLELGEAADYSDLAALRVADPEAPVSAPRLELRFNVQARTLDQLQAVHRARARSDAGGTCALYWGAWHMDAWRLYTPLQTAWTTWRATPYGLTGVNRVDLPPKAWTESADTATLTALTVVETASPASGSLYVPGGDIPFSLESNSDLVGSAQDGMLYLWYPVLVAGRIEVETEVKRTNDMILSVSFREAR